MAWHSKEHRRRSTEHTCTGLELTQAHVDWKIPTAPPPPCQCVSDGVSLQCGSMLKYTHCPLPPVVQ